MNERAIEDMLIGATPVMRRLRSLILRVAPTTLPVLIEGPTGSGKELVARALHLAGDRPGKFVALNVAAVGESLFEDALFGHVKGAFTGASSSVPGYLAEADRGTCFLDEIGALSFALQAKLLRAIESRSFRPVGARNDSSSDFRLVAATNESIARLVKLGRFREDLAFRLGGIVLSVPPLRDRPGDVPVLAEFFVKEAVAKRETAVTLSASAVHRLQQREWPGNVRELKHAIERIVALADGPLVEACDVRDLLAPPSPFLDDPSSLTNDTRVELHNVLKAVGWNTSKAADVLKVNRTTVYRRMIRLGIVVPEQRRGRAKPELNDR